MDITGVPHKINRHVIKALGQNCRDGLKFGELIEYVQYCNRNLKPVANLNQTVHKSLKNFQRLGLIVRDDKHRYKMVTLAVPQPNCDNQPSRSMRTESSSSTAQKRSFASSSRNSDESIRGVDAESARKRLKSQNYVGNRNKKSINLPRNKRQFADQLGFESNNPLMTGNTSSQANYDDESLLREPGDDDRDSGDDLCVKEECDQNQEKEDNPNEGMLLENDSDTEQVQCNLFY